MAEHTVSLCAGAGGLDIGVHAALGALGHASRTVCYVEREFAAAAVLAARMRDGGLDPAPVWTDLRAFDGRPWRGIVDGVVAGIPCQPHSYAGKRAGAGDERNLWPETAWILAAIRPRWFFLENVGGILRYYFDCIRPQLQGMGYRVAETLFTAEEVGAPHKRERLFVLAVAESGSTRAAGESRRSGGLAWGSGEALADAGHRPGSAQRSLESSERPEIAGRSGASDDVGNAHVPRLEGRREPVGGCRDKRALGQASAAMGLFPPGPGDADAWGRILRERPDLAPAVEPEVRVLAPGMADGVELTRAQQLRLTGNGVVPLQAARAFIELAGMIDFAGCGTLAP